LSTKGFPNTNGIPRQYFPNGTGLPRWSSEDIGIVALIDAGGDTAAELRLVDLLMHGAGCQQFFVSALGDDLTVLEKIDVIKIDQCTDPLGNVDGRGSTDEPGDRRLDPALGRRVQRAGSVSSRINTRGLGVSALVIPRTGDCTMPEHRCSVASERPRRLANWTLTSVKEVVRVMSGHSKWATTKHQKAVKDARRGKEFARLIKNIEVAARTGGGDPAGNPTLYDAIQKAKKTSVPNDNIERARKRGAGEEAGGADWQNITYEGYGPSGVAVLIECLTDNRNRAASEVRIAMTRNGGNMADPGSVSYLFTRKGVVTLEKNGLTEDDLLVAVLEAGAEDVNDLGDSFEIISEPTDLVSVRTALQDAGIEYDSADASFQPSVTVPVDLDGARKLLQLVDALEDSDDVQDVYTNIDIPDDIAAALDED